jgi:molybdopterin-containing oxidoreductase family iron-sulfur binding subunit
MQVQCLGKIMLLGIVIENHDERPVKVEGNEKHPSTLG